MSTLILEELNLVSLKQLLEMVDCEVKVGKILDVIGDREIFSQDQAKKIVAAVEHSESEGSRHRVIENLVEGYKGNFKGVVEIPLSEFAPIEPTLQTVMHAGRIPWLGKNLTLRIDTTDKTKLTITSKYIGPAFWPTLQQYCDAMESTMSLADLQSKVIQVFSEMHEDLVTNRIQNLASKVCLFVPLSTPAIEIKLGELGSGITKECLLVIQFVAGRTPKIYIRNPFLGEAFWPKIEVLNTLSSTIQDLLVDLVVAELAPLTSDAMKPQDIFKPK